MADLIGRQLGNYRLTSLLGSGGFAEVYLGEHVRLGMQAAIKVLHAHLAEDEAGAFQDEARIISELIHPHIIRVLDFDVENGTPFLVLDYAPQGSLSQRHKRGQRVPMAQIISYVEQVADALQYAHDRKHIHRDVKPANMLVGRHGEILLSDFGIASIAHSTSSMHTESPQGTLAYMAPEQLQGHARAASDQYALGVTVYQWLTGELPFRGSSIELVGQQLGGTPVSPRSVAPDIAPAVEQVVLTAMAKDPRARFQNIKTFASELARASQAQGPQTFSYTATTVANERKGPPPASYATTPILDSPASASRPASPDAQTYVDTQPPDRAQTYVNTTERVQPGSYLQPGVPYTPPEAARQPHVGWTVFWSGLVLGICVLVINFLTDLSLFSLLTRAGIVACLFCVGGWWAAQRTGLLKASMYTALLAIAFWLAGFFGLYYAIRFYLTSFNLLVTTSVIGIVLSLVGGLIGRRIHRSSHPIHSPAGGSRLS